jgi:hypothetical protein
MTKQQHTTKGLFFPLSLASLFFICYNDRKVVGEAILPGIL